MSANTLSKFVLFSYNIVVNSNVDNLQRLPDQPPLPVKDLEAEVTDNVADADAECDDDAEGDDEDVDGEVEEEEVTKKKV